MRHRALHPALAAFALGLVLATAPASFATPINGTFDIGGASLSLTALAVGFGCDPAIANAPCPAAAGYGNFLTTSATGSFAPYTFQGGFVHALGPPATAVNETFSLPDFLVFSTSPGNPVLPPDVALDLTFLFTGVDGEAQCALAPAPGQTCTLQLPEFVTPGNPLGFSPFNFQNTQTGSTLSFTVAGTARRISTGETTPFDGVFTAQFTVSYQQVLARLGADEAVTTSYSASFRAIPEPSTLALLGGGLALLARRRRARR
jgi:PEP-CTERM motif-containing protein